MKTLLMDRTGLYIENNEEELRVITCDHELGMVEWVGSFPTSYDEDRQEGCDEGCVKCERLEEELEDIYHNTIGRHFEWQ